MSSRHSTGSVAARLAILVLLGLGLLAGGTACNVPPECTRNADCGAGEVCQDGECVPETECNSNGDCTGDQICQNGQCGPCTTDTQCEDGQFCNGAETCVQGACQDGTEPCTADQTCDEDANSCGPAQSVFETNIFIDDFMRVHDLHKAAFPNCTTCHHDEPVPAGLVRCSECHSFDPNEFNSYKNMAHDENESGDGCRGCHDGVRTDEGDWDCSFCHTTFPAS